MRLRHALFALLFLAAFAGGAATAEPETDNCLITNMAAVSMIEADIEDTERFMERAKLTRDAYDGYMREINTQRSTIDDLVDLRAGLFGLSGYEAASKMTSLMSHYGPAADKLVANSRANDVPTSDVTRSAFDCAAPAE